MTVFDSLPLARRAQQAVPSAIREILKVTERPDIISFAGGLPAEELFPVEAMKRALDETLTEKGRAALQYGTTEGFIGLRAWVGERLSRYGRTIAPESVIITNGSQQGLDLIARVLLDPGDTVLVETPTYLAALQVFRSADARIVGVDADRDGVDLAALERAMKKERPKLLYLVPDHQNPSGARLALDRRPAVIALCKKYNVALLEDDPYGEICFEGARHPPLCAFDDGGTVIYLSTFSKTLAPGMRLGWMVAPPNVLRAVAIAKQATDLHSTSLGQYATAKLLERFDYDGHISLIRSVYKSRAQAMATALETHFGSEASWHMPTGGLFFWVALDADVSIDRLFERALEAKVAFVTGAPFFIDPPARPHMRLNFSHRPEPTIAEGMHRLAQVLKAESNAPALKKSDRLEVSDPMRRADRQDRC